VHLVEIWTFPHDFSTKKVRNGEVIAPKRKVRNGEGKKAKRNEIVRNSAN
jgi:hypothetical protein